MKLIRLIVAAVLLSVTLCVDAQSTRLSEKEKNAQRAVVDYLRNRGLGPSIDASDNSVCFKRNGVLYWVTVQEGSSDLILYTLYRNGIKYGDAANSKHNYRNDIGVLAANMLNTKHTYQAYQVPGAVKFRTPLYAKSIEEFKAAFPAMLANYDNVKSDFDAAYKRCRLKADSIHNYWQELDTANLIIPQQGVANTQPIRNLTISNISVRNVDASDNVISDFDQGIRRARCQFLQPRITVVAEKKGLYKIGVRIYTPAGKLLLPAEGARYTNITPIEVKKADKPETFNLLKFGSRDSEIWEPGEYKIEFYEDDNCIYTDAINIL